MLENGFDKFNLRVDYFSWGQYEQKQDDESNDDVGNNDDWFWWTINHLTTFYLFIVH